MTEEIPVVGLREPCPCGSGKRYKACHGKARNRESVAHVARPFEGLASECDWVAFREIVPAATAPLTLKDATDRRVVLTTVLPLGAAIPDLSTLVVSLDNVPLDPSQWTYDAVTNVITPRVSAAPGATITASWDESPVCSLAP